MGNNLQVKHITAVLISVMLLLSIGCDQRKELQQPNMMGLRVGQVLGAQSSNSAKTTAEFDKADKVRPFNFPADHGPHRSFASEWWYLTLVMETKQGGELGLQFTLFRQALEPQKNPLVAKLPQRPWQSQQLYLAHLSLSHVDTQQHVQLQRLHREHAHNATVTVEGGVNLRIEDWQLTQRSQTQWQLNAGQVGDFTVSLDLDLPSHKILQGNQGLSAKGPDSASYYYSIPGIAVSGVVEQGDSEYRVTGQGWFDREWSTSVLGDHLTGWDWFAFHLDNGCYFMMFQLRRHDQQRDEYDYGVADCPGGTVRKQVFLGPKDFELKPTNWWRDKRQQEWPVQWQLELSDPLLLGYQQMLIRAPFNAQLNEADIIYWEGVVDILGDNRRLGRGYMELTGY